AMPEATAVSGTAELPPAALNPAPAPASAAATPATVASTDSESAREPVVHADPAQSVPTRQTSLETPITQPVDDAPADPVPPSPHAESAPGSAPIPAAQLDATPSLPLPPLTDTYASEDGPYALPHAVEPPYSQVAAHIEHTLLGLLDDLTLPERYKDQALGMRERVARGLNWYELIPILDDLAVLMLAINDSGQHAFEAYLQALNERLEAFHSHLRDASAGHADNQDAARQLDTALREHVDGLQHSVQGAHDLDSLKQVLDSRLEGLIGTLDEHQQARDRREQALAERLQGLAARVASMEQEALGFREHLEEQRQKALIDPLTGLPNRAAWAERVAQELHAWQAQGGHLSMAIFDLDHFKRINDGYGHLAGDKVLKLVANVLRKRLRGRDFMARFGGEEFVLLMPQTAPAAAAQHVEGLRAAVEACPFHFKGEPVTITTSIGLSAFRPGEASEVVLDRADKALYRAKGQGRNRIEQG
ncbi:diguanylate cyclase, partial [Pseudomonas sp.]|uniref:diguanylate cyclase n=1 Tax=Pseudomonas sp. TaxID=306 RepID=UPI0028AF27E6